uniref:Retrovirus-related Pol polyprotein from transposon TNT 1-94 n=1 Tax=Tanacetum cinerariifolium TaxID=118510 RepID=A0A6L2JE52_TANCI|nr:retrovirus-related Pol polyprotein from transposon TNT 1-94 [Tanacetum cinerariifolium]
MVIFRIIHCYSGLSFLTAVCPFRRDLTQEEKDRYKADIQATNILLQGLSKDIYTLINHYTDAKDIWDNVKMLLEGSELTKDDRESQLYDDFEHFKQNKGETIHDYYVRFTKLVNDMRNIKMTMAKIQLNSKFVNNMQPEWGRFVMTVKLNRGLKESNHDQLYAYLRQHEMHANENRMLMERFAHQPNDLFAFLSQGSRSEYSRETDSDAEKQCSGNCTHPKRPHNSDYYKDKMLLLQAHKNGAVLDEDSCYSSRVNRLTHVDDAPTAQTMFMANLSSARLVFYEAGPSYDSDTISEASPFGAAPSSHYGGGGAVKI